MPIRLTSAQYKIIALALAVALLSLAVSLRYFRRSFPEASLSLRVDRAQSEAIALKFLADTQPGLPSLGSAPLHDYRHTGIFTYDDGAKLYLERTLGLEAMNRLTEGPIHLWRWSHRWFRPQQEVEYDVDVTPTGQVVGFRRAVPENEAGKNLDRDQARAIAENFLQKTLGRDLSKLEFLQAEDRTRPSRTDHSFTWKEKNVALGEGSYRVALAVSGDSVTSYAEYVQVPEQWSRDYARLRSRNDSAQMVDEILFYLLTAAMMVMLILRLRLHDVPVRTASGFALAAAVLYCFSQLNSFSLAQSSYSTTDSYASFVARYFTGTVLSALGVGAFIFFLVAAAEPEYRRSYPHAIALRRYFSWRGLRTRSFFMANVAGLALAFFFFGYQTLFYLFANKLGAWAPSDIPFTNQLNTQIPWMAVLFGGFFPAVSEEMQFRVFAIPFLTKLTRSLPAAIVLAAFNWGFLHSAYPNQPFFIRGLEVGLGGILIGVVMLRFGILATLIWHYSVDALYSAFLLLRSPNHYLMASGGLTAGFMLLPLAVALVAYLRSGTFADEAPLANSEFRLPALPPPAESGAAPEITYERLGRRRLVLAAAVTALFAALAVIPAYRFGQGVKVRMTAADAVRSASLYLRRQGINPAAYRHVPDLLDNVQPAALRYMTEHVSLKEADRIWRSATQMIVWEVRYFQPLQVQEHRLYFDASDGSFVDHRRSLDENAPGASLPPEQARALAERALQDHGYRLADFVLQDINAEKRPARQDFSFTWEAKAQDPRNVLDERYRVTVDIAGDQVASVSDYFKLPEEWLRRREGSSLSNSLLGLAALLLSVLLAVAAVSLFVGELRHHSFPWRAAAPVGLALAALSVLGELNALPTLLRGYNTSIPLGTFWLQTGAKLILMPILTGVGSWVLAAFAFSLYPKAQALLRRSAARPWRRDAAWASLLALSMGFGLDRLGEVLTARWPALFPPRLDLAPSYLDTWSPALAHLLSIVPGCVLATAGIAVVIAIFQAGWSRRAWWIWAALLLLAIALGPASARSAAEFFAPWAYSALRLAVAVWIVATFFRDNALAYLSAVFCVMAAPPVIELLSQGAPLYRWNGLALAAVSLAIAAWLLAPDRTGGSIDRGLSALAEKSAAGGELS